ncbi:MAG TPA: hypothetical protein VIY90_05340 [Steroidobacteraceae bacterium]
MSPQAPPRWLETLLLQSLPARDRETISGDLLEEYREVKLPHLGAMRANIWYARQLISFLAARSLGGSAMRASLTWMSALTVLAGVWLAVMENILRHPGYAGRSAIAACIVIQGLATVLFLMWHGRPMLRVIVLAGAVGVALLGAAAIIRILNAPHFEGFVLLIGAALIAQGMMALLVVGGVRHGTTV